MLLGTDYNEGGVVIHTDGKQTIANALARPPKKKTRERRYQEWLPNARARDARSGYEAIAGGYRKTEKCDESQ